MEGEAVKWRHWRRRMTKNKLKKEMKVVKKGELWEGLDIIRGVLVRKKEST